MYVHMEVMYDPMEVKDNYIEMLYDHSEVMYDQIEFQNAHI